MRCFNQFGGSSQIYNFRDTVSPVKQYFAVVCPSVLKSGAPNEGFLLTLKTFFILPRVLYSTASDPRPQVILIPQVIPKMDRK